MKNAFSSRSTVPSCSGATEQGSEARVSPRGRRRFTLNSMLLTWSLPGRKSPLPT